MQGEIIGWAEYSLRFELRLHADGSVVVGTVSREAMEHLLEGGLILLHRHVRAQVKVREMRLRNRVPRKTFALQAIEMIETPPGWPQRTGQQSI